MYPEKKILIVSHCVLNQNSVLPGWERARGAYPVIKAAMDRGIGLIQLPCPELLTMGLDRPPMDYAQYAAVPGFTENCKEMLKPILLQIRIYLKENYRILGVLGIHESPNCSITAQRGILMEQLFSETAKLGLNLNYLEIPTEYEEANEGMFHAKMKEFLDKIL